MTGLVIHQNKIDVSVSSPLISDRLADQQQIIGDERTGSESVQDVRQGPGEEHVDEDAEGRFDLSSQISIAHGELGQDRKYFDSGDYMMSKAGIPTAQAPGSIIPSVKR